MPFKIPHQIHSLRSDKIFLLASWRKAHLKKMVRHSAKSGIAHSATLSDHSPRSCAYQHLPNEREDTDFPLQRMGHLQPLGINRGGKCICGVAVKVGTSRHYERYGRAGESAELDIPVASW